MRFTSLAAGVVAGAALLAAPVAANAAPSSPVASRTSPCASPGGFDQVQPGQSVQQVQQEMGSTGNTSDRTAQGGFVREEITWRNCSTPIGQLGVLDDGVTFYATPSHPLAESSKTQFVLLGG